MAKKKAGKTKPGKKTEARSKIRLQKFLAQAGLGSRRECEELIVEGRITVDGQVADRLGMTVDPDSDKVRFDGAKVKPTRPQYYIVHKPTGVLSTCRDPEGRLRVIDLIKTDQRVYNVGRLDKSSEGLILVTNDGELANRLTHPRYGVKKTYHVTVAGNPHWNDLQMLKRGIRLAEAVARVSDIKVRKRRKDSCDLVIVLEEGRNREIRRLLAHIGHKVTRLRRVAIGPLQLGNLKAGDYRRLEPGEVAALLAASSNVKQKQGRRSRPVETSQLAGRKRKRTTKKKTVATVRGEKKKPSRVSKKSSKKKKRSTATESRRGAGRLKKSSSKKTGGKASGKRGKASGKRGKASGSKRGQRSAAKRSAAKKSGTSQRRTAKRPGTRKKSGGRGKRTG